MDPDPDTCYEHFIKIYLILLKRLNMTSLSGKSFTFMRVRLKNTFMKNELHAHKECIIIFMAPMYMNFKDTVALAGQFLKLRDQ